LFLKLSNPGSFSTKYVDDFEQKSNSSKREDHRTLA
jgi:hypothetical protein